MLQLNRQKNGKFTICLHVCMGLCKSNKLQANIVVFGVLVCVVTVTYWPKQRTQRVQLSEPNKSRYVSIMQMARESYSCVEWATFHLKVALLVNTAQQQQKGTYVKVNAMTTRRLVIWIGQLSVQYIAKRKQVNWSICLRADWVRTSLFTRRNCLWVLILFACD